MKILSLIIITLHHVVPNLYDFRLKDILKNVLL